MFPLRGDRQTALFWISIPTILILTGLVSSYELAQPSLWVDEAFTWWFTRMPWKQMMQSVRQDGVNPPFYYLAVKAWLGLIGVNEFALRAPSVLANLLGVLFAFHLGYRVGGLPGALAGGWFWGFHPMTLWFARDARPYALAAALAGFVTIAFLSLRQRVSIASGAATVVALALGLLTHYFFFVLAASFIAIVLCELRRSPAFFRHWTLMSLLAFLPLAGWLVWYFIQAQPSLGIGWIQKPPIDGVAWTFWNLLSGYGGVLSWPATIFGAFAGLLVASALLMRWKDRIIRHAFLLGVLLPIGAVWVISQRRPVYVDRYFIVLLPLVVLLVAAGANRLWTQVVDRSVPSGQGFVPSALLIILGTIGIWSGWQVHSDGKYAKEDWRGLTSVLMSAQLEDSTLWLSEPEASLPLSYYGLQHLEMEISQKPPACPSTCWWVLRQPYTATHAFTQSVSLPGRPWKPDLTESCPRVQEWQSPTGLQALKIDCSPEND